jgi:2',3'-cyclic-nucleotide 2'-phosphodiesterase (5'-nucleotidase family)
VARRATVIRGARAKAEHVLVLDAGNSLLYDDEGPDSAPGAVSAAVMDQLGYDAVALGSGDLSALGPEGVARLRDEASFTLLSANAYAAGSSELAAAPYALLNLGERRLAVIGLTDVRDTPGWEIRDPLQAVKALMRQLRREADVIILLSHAAQNTNRQIALGVKGIDVIIMGGSQTLAEPTRLGSSNTLLLHAEGMAGANVGLAELYFDAQANLAEFDWERIRLDAQIPEDMQTLRWLFSLWD